LAKKKARELGELERKKWVGCEEESLSIARQCELVSLPRSTYYYRAQEESGLNLELMNLIDAICMESSSYGSRKITEELKA
jgi:putative transposase